ncbi:MAG: hypothetical protein WDW38_001449 [Sanguina aurantia]
MTSEVLRFTQLQSCVDPSFWSELGNRKLDAYKLSEAAIELEGRFTSSRYVEAIHRVPGTLVNLNTLEGFCAADKPVLMQKAAHQIWQDICSGAAVADPSKLCRFLLLTHGDLKQFHFHYWFAFPALKPPSPYTVESCKTVASAVSAERAAQLVAACDAWQRGSSALWTGEPAHPATAGQSQPDSNPPAAGTSSPTATTIQGPALSPPPFWLLRLGLPESGSGSGSAQPGVTALPLSGLTALQALSQSGGSGGGGGLGGVPEHVWLCFSDPSNLPDNPGWPLRNLLLLAVARWGAKNVTVGLATTMRVTFWSGVERPSQGATMDPQQVTKPVRTP